MDRIFKALADPSRRALLDKLFVKDGQSLGDLCAGVSFSRQATSKHLRILEEADLIVTHWAGREKLHYLNPIPIQQIAERWIAKYAARSLGAMTSLKKALEDSANERED